LRQASTSCPRSPAHVELARGHVRRACGLPCNIRNSDAECGGACEIDGDAHIVRRSAVDVDERDARHCFDARLDDVFDQPAVTLDRPLRAGQQLHEEERQVLVGIPFGAAELDYRPVDIARQRRQAAHAANHVHQRGLHVGADCEGQEHLAAARTGVAVDFLDAGQSLQHLLLRLEQLRFHFFGRSAAPVGEDGNGWTLDVREQLQRQLPQAEGSEQADQQHRNADRDGVAYGSSDDAHWMSPSVFI